MKKTLNVAIGGCSFIIDEDACEAISEYLDRYKAAIGDQTSVNEAMEELEVRIADCLKALMGGKETVSLKMAEEAIRLLGFPQGCKTEDYSQRREDNSYNYQDRPVRKFFRDTDDKKIAGVCSGLALFFGIDVVILRVIFLIALICGSTGFWVYLVVWIAAPEARTPEEKCSLRGIPPTPENIRRFTRE